MLNYVSVSGEWMSASRMQQEFAGDASVPDHSTRKREKLRVNLFFAFVRSFSLDFLAWSHF